MATLAYTSPAFDARAGLVAPERSLNQRMEALRHANETRSARASVKRDLGAGRVSIRRLIADPPDFVEAMKLLDLLLAAPKHGRVKVNKILSQCRISPSKTIGGLSERQRREVLSLVGAPTACSKLATPTPLVQRMDALNRANVIRLARADLKHRIATGVLTVADVLRDPPEFVASMPVCELLKVPCRWGPTRARKLLRSVMIGEIRPIGNLTERQRLVLARRLDGGA